jgi:hypothetical protein
MWLKEQGIFTGSTIGGNFCFSPDKSVSRGEFLVMVMNLVHAKADRTAGCQSKALKAASFVPGG